MIPSIITKKTFPSCIRSFNGYPLDMDGDASALLYIVCATLKIRQSTRPWSTLPKIKKSKEDSITMKYVEKIGEKENREFSRKETITLTKIIKSYTHEWNNMMIKWSS